MNLALSWQARQAPRPHHDKNQIRTNKDDGNDAKVWALHEGYDQDTRSRAPLDSTAIYPITRSLTKHNETGKIETLSRSYLCLALKPLEVDEDDLQSSSPQDAPPFFIALRLVKIHTWLPHTPRWEKHLFGISSLGLEGWSTRTKPWSTHIFSSLNLDSNKWRSSNSNGHTYKCSSIQTLVHRDCH